MSISRCLLTVAHWVFLLFVIVNLSACGVFGVISGEIVAVQSQYSYKGDFKFTSESHAIIRLYLEEDSETNRTIKEHTIDNITEFPVPFSISVGGGVDFSTLRISAQVISGEGDETYVGDFISEEVTAVERFGSTTVKVFGLEHCDEPYSGGFCSKRERE
ncbi:MAG: hypothetical protein OXK80_05840 [Bdellovibrionales bacterium]|nr:hypothetical protein [Bdellovibrionales bacterium]